MSASNNRQVACGRGVLTRLVAESIGPVDE